MLKFDKVFCFDFETESLNLVQSRPQQIAYTYSEKGRVIESAEFKILWKDLRMSADAARVTHFDKNKYLNEAIDPMIVWKKTQKYFLNKDVALVFHNGLNFDCFQIKTWLVGIGQWPGFKHFYNRFVDTRALYQAFVNKTPVDKVNFDSWQYIQIDDRKKGVKTTLKAMCEALGIEFDEKLAHDAIYDTEKTTEAFNQLKYRLSL
jgi:DNA polymerase III alpha subunit (gram-positive type)